ncbi:MAG: hypothetical protein HQL16_03650 [Candidatus Omnitrophica bacterium]|nr:hypothetical protein [Candidatus Omnitrophota bacterium]
MIRFFLCCLMLWGIMFSPKALSWAAGYDDGRTEIVSQALLAYEQESEPVVSSQRSSPAITDNESSPVPFGMPVPASLASSSTTPTSSDFANAVGGAVQRQFGEGWHPSADIHGRLRLAMGINTSGDAIFTRANPDLNERNWRILDNTGLNHYSNTYDPGIYSSLRLLVDATILPALTMHILAVADPWSYRGKTETASLSGTWSGPVDQVRVQYYSFGNDGYTFNRIVNTDRIGKSLAIPETKIIKGNIVPAQALAINNCNPAGTSCDTVNVPQMKLDYEFQPIREFWVDVKPSEHFSLRIFPIAYEDQALTSDDPLSLSNKRTYWEESPWIREWHQGNLNQPVNWDGFDFTQGYWDRSIAFSAKDSSGQHLTALRGVSTKIRPDGSTTIEGTLASPQNPWEDYNQYNTLAGSARAKRYWEDDFYLGSTLNMHRGFTTDPKPQLDAWNYVESVDAAIMAMHGVKVLGQVSKSQAQYDLTRPDYATKHYGDAYYVGIQTSTNQMEMIKKDYFSLQPYKGEDSFYKTRLYYARMDKNFESSLSSYGATQKDSAWSRNMTFYPSIYRNMPGNEPTMSENDLAYLAFGDGMNYDRQVIGWRADAVLDDNKILGTADFRRVMTAEDKSVETVSHGELTYKATDKLTTKVSALHHALPNTTALDDGRGLDPLMFDANGNPLINPSVQKGLDPSMSTGAVGARYDATDWMSVNGVFMRTNDILMTDNYPRGLFNSSNSWYAGDLTQINFRHPTSWLYSQQYFDQPPYGYHDILKGGILLKPLDVWNIYLDYTRNPNKFAGGIDDNINHFGIETSYVPNPKLGFFARYTFSKWYDIARLAQSGELKYEGFNNFFIEGRYLATKDDKFSIMYGVGPAYNVTTSTTDPALAYYTAPVLQTEHIIRMSYEKKF